MLSDPINVLPSPYSRTLCVRLLSALHSSRPLSFVSDLTSTPGAINNLVDLLTADRNVAAESVRNEVLLLLKEMCGGSETVRKLLAFEEGFDKIFDIVR